MEVTAEVKDRLSSLIEEREVPLAPLAAKIGVSQSTLWNFIYGDTRNFSKLHRLVAELNVSLDWVLGNTQAPPPSRDAASEPAPMPMFNGHIFRYPEPMIPIFGRPFGAFDAVLVHPHEKIGEIECHPAQKSMKSAFAVYVVGEAMVPRYRPGELVYAASMKPPAAGQDCIVELTNGEGYIREFLAHNGGVVLCKMLNPVQETRWLANDVKALHAVVGRG
jgi:phage repressor protein C with HTH and peptisase S24 domain